jgi:hypothetical protein
MPTFDYASLRDDADAILDEFGLAGTLRQRATSGADAWSPTVTDTDTACVVLFDEYNDRERDGTLITERDRKVLIKAGSLGVVPTTGDQLIVSSIAYSLMNVRQVAPGGTVVLYEAMARL